MLNATAGVQCRYSVRQQQHSEVTDTQWDTVPTSWEKAGDTPSSPSAIGHGMQRCQRGCLRAALGWFILIFADEPRWPWPGNHQPAPPHSAEPPFQWKASKWAARSRLPPHVRRLLAGSSHSQPKSIKAEAVKMSIGLQLSQRDLCVFHLPHSAGSTSIIPNDMLYFP